MTTKQFQNTVWKYYDEHGRHDLPWRVNLDPYAIVVSEVMLQQTQVERVIPKFTAWMKDFPTWLTLASAPVSQVLKQWQGLGYNRRALALARCAQKVVLDFEEMLPSDEVSLLTLPGVGPYTAAAVQAFAFNQPVTMIETNIRTVFIHHYFPFLPHPQPLSLPRRGERWGEVDDLDILPLVEQALDKKRPREWYWALMDYGSFLKKQHGNISRRSRQYVRQSSFEGSHRQVRGAIIRLLTQRDSASERALIKYLAAEGIAAQRVASALTALEREGFVVRGKRQRLSLMGRVQHTVA